MANYTRAHGSFYQEEYVVCPLNSEHIIREGRFQYHLVRCFERFPHKERVQRCPFNATHLVLLPASLEQHMSMCPNKVSVLLYKYTPGATDLRDRVLPISNRIAESLDEDWSECNSATYNPKKQGQVSASTSSDRKRHHHRHHKDKKDKHSKTSKRDSINFPGVSKAGLDIIISDDETDIMTTTFSELSIDNKPYKEKL
ncbi:gametocyte-specific factor 1 homolog [Neocloeon triangulifer]|uniref:gametocyte-specific factor 1 homolog n=1 Tax=Neocloeon triangulifer TaxID=2078957 RepID=UPI00286F885B|nr:gametocyte-specific factor 1 homolog [Neocloeon triangulifer]XP_059476445.1 gametocyte-specific factor 1 homolog [Neocloeon triangulifer]XP_059476446.1 gametocyte-specific factor 1 homolog [Neocloeon triangulifer]